MKKVLLALSCASSIGLCSVAEAAIVSFDFLNTVPVGVDNSLNTTYCSSTLMCGNSFQFTNSGLTLTATGARPNGNPLLVTLDHGEPNGNRGGLGLGAQRNTTNLNIFEQLDRREVLFLDFSNPVSYQSAQFHNYLHTPGFLPGDDVSIQQLDADTIRIRYTGNGDGVYLAHLTVSADVMPPVPEPSTWALLGVGLLGLGYMARRRTKNS